MTRLPTPRATDGTKGGPNQRGSSGDLMLPSAVTLLPTPAVNDMGAGKTVDEWDAWTDRMKTAHGNGNGHGKSLEIEAQRLLPTPRAQDSDESPTTFDRRVGALQSAEGRSGGRTGTPLGVEVQRLLPTPNTSDALGAKSPEKIAEQRARTPGGYAQLREAALSDFGPYAAAIARWEQVLGRPAPPPTEPGQNGRPRLSPRFVEFMMGLPDGWVTGVDIPRSAQLKVLGNGVVPQQALLALALLDGDGATVVGSTDRLLPTPTSNDKAGRAKVSPNQPKLPATILTLLPQEIARGLLDGDGATVVGSTDRLLPTPTSNDKAGRAKVSPNQPKLPATILTLLPQEIARGLLDGDGATVVGSTGPGARK